MKKIIFFLAMLTISGLSTNAQWVQTNGPFGGQDVTCLAVIGNNLFAGTLDHGVFITNNNGNSWMAVNNGLNNKTVKSLIVSNNNIFAATYGGVFLSGNNGNSWTAVNNGMPAQSGSDDTIVMSLAMEGSDLYAGLYLCDSDGVYKSSNNGASWAAVNNGLPYEFPTPSHYHNILLLGVCGSYVFASPEINGMWVSNNNGASWSSANNGIPTNWAEGYCFASNGTDIFVGGVTGIAYSNNNGGLWTLLTNGLPGTDMYSLYIDGSNIFAGADMQGVYLSTNNGALWTNVSTNGIANKNINSFAVIGDTIFAGDNSSGVWKRAISQMVGIEEFNNYYNISIYPNPATDNLTIESPLHSNIEITNIQGQLIKTLAASGTKSASWRIDVSALPCGVYVVQVKTEKGVTVRKFIKE